MHLVMLINDSIPPIPDNITLEREFGSETIVTDTNDEVEGKVCLVTGEPAAFAAWFSGLEGIWVCTHPILGTWEIRRPLRDVC